MLSGDAAVIENGDTIETVVTSKVGDFDKLAAYCDTQIAKVILGGNLTSEVKGGSFAAAETHNDIRTDIAMTDEHIVTQAINDVLEAFKAINALDIDITVALKDKDDPNTQLAERDAKISSMGYTPTQEYIESTYNIKVTPTPTLKANSFRAGNPFVFSKKPQDSIGAGLDAIDTDPVMMSLQKQMLRIIEEAESFEDAFKAIEEAYPGLEFEQLEEMLSSAMLNADILGSAEIEDENPEG